MCIGKTKRFIQYQIDRLQISLFSQSGSDHLTNPPVSESGFLLRENQNPNPDLVAEVINHSDLDQQHFFFLGVQRPNYMDPADLQLYR